MRLVLRGSKGSPGRAGRAWRSTRVGAFVAGLNGQPERLNDLAERFPRRQRRWQLLCLSGVTLVALAVRIPLLGDGYAAPDTSQYLEVAHHVFQGGFPDNLRPPGFAFLLALFDAIGADPVTAVVLLQNLIGIVLPAGILLIGWRFFSPAVGIMAGFLAAASPLMIITEQLALADYLFGVLLLIGTALLAEAALRVRAGRAPRGLLIGVGATFAIATLFRANGLLALVAMPIVLLIAARQWRSALRGAAISLTAMIVVLAPWSLHNLIRFGDPNIASEGGVSLYARVITWDAVPPPADSPAGELALSIYNTAEPGEPGAPRSGLPTTALFNTLILEGRSPGEASALMGGLAREAVFEYPDIYLENTWAILKRFRSLYDPRALGPEPNRDHIAATRHYFQYLNLPDNVGEAPIENLQARRLPGDSIATRAPWQAAQALTRILYLITIGGALILLLPFLGAPPRRLAATAFLAVLLLGFVGGSLTAVFSLRYGLMFAPMIWVVLAAAAMLIVEVLVAVVRQRAWRRPQGAAS